MVNKYEIGHRHEDGNIYYTGCNELANSSDEAICLYCANSAIFDADKSEYVANLIEINVEG